MTDVRELFRRGIDIGDAAAMRAGFEQLLGIGDQEGLSADREAELRREDFVMRLPQSREVLRGRETMRQFQSRFPGPPPRIRLHDVRGGGRTWVLEGGIDYGDDPWLVVLIAEFDEDASIAAETRYYTQSFAPPQWRADLVSVEPDE